MGELIVRTKERLPLSVAPWIKGIRLEKGRHWKPPEPQGTTAVVCGRHTLNEVCKVLAEFGVPIDRVEIRESKGHNIMGRLTIINPPSSVPDTGFVVVEPGVVEETALPSPIPAPMPERGIIYIAKEESQAEQNRARVDVGKKARYKRWLHQLDEPRRTSMGFALYFIADNINAALGDEPRLCPWHLIRLEEIEGKRRISFTPLSEVFPPLAQSAWNYVHAVERSRDVVKAENSLVDTVKLVTENPQILALFPSLALEGR